MVQKCDILVNTECSRVGGDLLGQWVQLFNFKKYG